MWAEWMKDYDLSLTKEEIEEYFKLKREKKIKLINEILKQFKIT